LSLRRYKNFKAAISDKNKRVNRNFTFNTAKTSKIFKGCFKSKSYQCSWFRIQTPSSAFLTNQVWETHFSLNSSSILEKSVNVASGGGLLIFKFSFTCFFNNRETSFQIIFLFVLFLFRSFLKRLQKFCYHALQQVFVKLKSLIKAVVLNLGSIEPSGVRRSRFRGSTKVIWNMNKSVGPLCN